MFVKGLLLATVAIFAVVLLIKLVLAVAAVALFVILAIVFIRRLSILWTRRAVAGRPRIRNVRRVAPLTKPSIRIR